MFRPKDGRVFVSTLWWILANKLAHGDRSRMDGASVRRFMERIPSVPPNRWRIGGGPARVHGAKVLGRGPRNLVPGG